MEKLPTNQKKALQRKAQSKNYEEKRKLGAGLDLARKMQRGEVPEVSLERQQALGDRMYENMTKTARYTRLIQNYKPTFHKPASVPVPPKPKPPPPTLPPHLIKTKPPKPPPGRKLVSIADTTPSLSKGKQRANFDPGSDSEGEEQFQSPSPSPSPSPFRPPSPRPDVDTQMDETEDVADIDDIDNDDDGDDDSLVVRLPKLAKRYEKLVERHPGDEPEDAEMGEAQSSVPLDEQTGQVADPEDEKMVKVPVKRLNKKKPQTKVLHSTGDMQEVMPRRSMLDGVDTPFGNLERKVTLMRESEDSLPGGYEEFTRLGGTPSTMLNPELDPVNNPDNYVNAAAAIASRQGTMDSFGNTATTTSGGKKRRKRGSKGKGKKNQIHQTVSSDGYVDPYEDRGYEFTVSSEYEQDLLHRRTDAALESSSRSKERAERLKTPDGKPIQGPKGLDRSNNQEKYDVSAMTVEDEVFYGGVVSGDGGSSSTAITNSITELERIRRMYKYASSNVPFLKHFQPPVRRRLLFGEKFLECYFRWYVPIYNQHILSDRPNYTELSSMIYQGMHWGGFIDLWAKFPHQLDSPLVKRPDCIYRLSIKFNNHNDKRQTELRHEQKKDGTYQTDATIGTYNSDYLTANFIMEVITYAELLEATAKEREEKTRNKYAILRKSSGYSSREKTDSGGGSSSSSSSSSDTSGMSICPENKEQLREYMKNMKHRGLYSRQPYYHHTTFVFRIVDMFLKYM